MTDQNIGLRVGAACNQAANVLTGSYRLLADGTLTHEQLVEIHRELSEGFFANAQTLQAAQGIADAFPGTTAVPQAQFGQAAPQQATQAPQAGFQPANQAPQNVVQAPFGQQAPQQAPGVQAAGSKVDQEWQALFNNPSGFYDNRQDKKNPNGPDFKNKQSGEGLWLNGKFGPAPQWVLDRLQGGYGPVQ